MNEYEEQLDQQLERLGAVLRSQPSIVRRGVSALETLSPARPRRSLVFLPSRARSGLGLAAGLLAGVGLWFWLAGPANITLAEVQRSIDSKPWVLIRFEDGTQEWFHLRERRSFLTYANSHDFYAGMRDHVNGIRRAYHSNWGRQIHEERFTPGPCPQTPWEYATGDWRDPGRGPLAPTSVERFPDTIDGKEVVRFDTYDLGPVGLRVLARQVWADPKTRLPVRIRKYREPGENRKPYTGDFSFPESGPASIHDLGAPQGLPVVVNWGIIEPAAKAIVEAGKEALRQFPRKVRIVRKSTYKVSISYSLGDKFRQETYGLVSTDHRSPLGVALPDNGEQIRAWASRHLTLFEVRLHDGQFTYSYDTGRGLWPSPTDPGATLSVRRYSDPWSDSLMPLRDQWPFLSNVGPMQVVDDVPDTLAGAVLLRYETPGLRRDWYVDPARDHICVKQVEFSLNADRTVQRERGHVERMDLSRLPAGQWYAKTTVRPGVPSGTAELDVQPLSEAQEEELAREDRSGGFFSGEKLLKEAQDAGAKVTFWAR